MRISTTTLELFRRWKEPDQEWLDESELIANIKGESKPSPAMLLGRAFGEVIETPSQFAVYGNEIDAPAVRGYQHFLDEKGQRVDTYFFEGEMMVPVLALFDYQHGLFEVKHQKRYGDVDVVAKCDYIFGAALGENKTTENTVDFDKYERSYQWRFEMDIFGSPICTYNVFQLHVGRDRKTEAEKVELKDIVRFNVFPYPALSSDCQSLVDEFVEYARARGLDAVLRARQQAATGVGI